MTIIQYFSLLYSKEIFSNDSYIILVHRQPTVIKLLIKLAMKLAIKNGAKGKNC